MTNRKSSHVGILAGLLLSCGCTGNSVIHDVFGGRRAYDTVKAATREDGVFVGGEDFDNGRPQIVRFIKKVFPNNSEIQGLPETGSGLGHSDDA